MASIQKSKIRLQATMREARRQRKYERILKDEQRKKVWKARAMRMLQEAIERRKNAA